MSLDLKPVRTAIRNVVATVPGVQLAVGYENRDYSLSQLPVAMLWRDESNIPGVAERQGEFGSITRTFTWRIRVLIAMGANDEATQDLIDDVEVSLMEVFHDQANIATLQTAGVDLPALTLVSHDALTELANPIVLIEATLETDITWTP